MFVRVNGQPHKIYTRDPNASFESPLARASCRTPSGHPEGYLEAFANIYVAAYEDMIKRAQGGKIDSAKKPVSQCRRRARRHEFHHSMRG
jgi:hypothetical protein